MVCFCLCWRNNRFLDSSFNIIYCVHCSNYIEDENDSCENDPNWAPNEPDPDAFEYCVEMSGVSAHGYYNGDRL